MGFGVPLGAWFRGNLRQFLRDVLLAPDARYRSMLSASFVTRMVERHLAGDANLGPQLWSLVCFERWLQMLPDWTRRATSPDDMHPAAHRV
jgi:asparagine synthase (glutamine-hydrolysing)